MKIRFVFVAGIVLFLIAVGHAHAKQFPESVVKLCLKSGNSCKDEGSGVIVQRKGQQAIIVTNVHVVQSIGSKVDVSFYKQGEIYNGTVIRTAFQETYCLSDGKKHNQYQFALKLNDKKCHYDLALVEIKLKEGKKVSIAKIEQKKPTKNTPVCAYGFAVGVPPPNTCGRIENVKDVQSEGAISGALAGGQTIVHTAHSVVGMSGGGVFTNDRLIAITEIAPESPYRACPALAVG